MSHPHTDSSADRPVEDLASIEVGRFEYRTALERQRALVAARGRDEVPDLVWYLEHEPVVTWNPGRGDRYLKAPRERFEAAAVALEETDRGGDVTYHGPGQLVGYPIVDLGSGPGIGRDLHRYLRALEEALIETLASLGLEGTRFEGRTGVWVGDEKVAAIGVRSSRWITLHGFALNVSCDLTPFRELIVPCGISDRGVTSLERLLSPGTISGTAELVPTVHGALERALGRPLALTLDSFTVHGPKLE